MMTIKKPSPPAPHYTYNVQSPLKSRLATAIKVFAVDIDGTLTENGGGAVHIPALSKLRYLDKLGYNVIYVTGRSSIEAYVLAVFGGTTKI
ncbi:MAG TPA: hypothetical protein VFA15_01945, partial [Nitrososphaera sp.]|nr:hypothetical protein [Nitrososphaera sp.]